MLQLRQNQSIDIRLRPARVHFGCGRNGRHLQRLERPEGPLLGRDDVLAALRSCHRRCCFVRDRPVGARLHPCNQILDFLILELAAHRHLELRIGLPHRLDDEALVGIARDHRRPRLSALQDPVAAVHAQAAKLGRSVTREAVVDQYRPDSRLEKVRTFGRGRGGQGDCSERDQPPGKARE